MILKNYARFYTVSSVVIQGIFFTINIYKLTLEMPPHQLLESKILEIDKMLGGLLKKLRATDAFASQSSYDDLRVRAVLRA